MSDYNSTSPENAVFSGKGIVFNIPEGTRDYEALLQLNGIGYKLEDFYLTVGEVVQTQGWILHLSVMKYQVEHLFSTVIPFFISNNICFKIPFNEMMKDQLIDGMWGYEKLGKVVTVYPVDIDQAIWLARHLIQVTAAFRGPVIPTDVHLGAVVYTRYGSFIKNVQMNESGKMDNYIYGIGGVLIKDSYPVPFKLPKGVNWPFTALTKFQVSRPKKIYKRKYLPFFIIKPDVKGRVMKGINVSKWFSPNWCLIKEGKMGMCSDEAGRDMVDRMQWQYELYMDLYKEISLPEIFDYFEDNNNAYLVMEFIEGASLDELQAIVFKRRIWRDLKISDQQKIIDVLLNVIDVIERLHKRGYVHRDITAANFMLDESGKLFLIDMELAYSFLKGRPDPHFRLGTPGSMSPEQQNGALPAIEQDIYSIGVLLLVSFARLAPHSFDVSDPGRLYKNIAHFIPNGELARCITACLSFNPADRPALAEIRETVTNYRIVSELSQGNTTGFVAIDQEELLGLIDQAILGMSSPLITTEQNCWSSLTVGTDVGFGNARGDRTYLMGFREGISGSLFLLGRARKIGFDITSCKKTIDANLQLLDEQYLVRVTELSSGLMNGAAGIAIALKCLIDNEWISDDVDNINLMKACLDLPVLGFDIASGVAGLGLAIFHCSSYLEENYVGEKLTSYVNVLLTNQLPDGSWVANAQQYQGKVLKSTGLFYGVAGIAWFLLEYSRRYNNDNTLAAGLGALNWLMKQVKKEGEFLYWETTIHSKEADMYLENGYSGVALVFIKAYEVTFDPMYREIAERTLSFFPERLVEPDLTQCNGLSGLGEVYLEAYRVFGNGEWRDRATWIAGVLMHTAYNSQHGAYWLLNDPTLPNADLLVGNGGPLYFLMHYAKQASTGFILLPE